LFLLLPLSSCYACLLGKRETYCLYLLNLLAAAVVLDSTLLDTPRIVVNGKLYALKFDLFINDMQATTRRQR